MVKIETLGESCKRGKSLYEYINIGQSLLCLRRLTYLKSLEHPHLVRDCIDGLEYVVEDGDEQVDEEDVGHQEVHGHDCWGQPAARVAGDLTLASTVRVNVSGKHFSVQHKIWLKNCYFLSA